MKTRYYYLHFCYAYNLCSPKTRPHRTNFWWFFCDFSRRVNQKTYCAVRRSKLFWAQKIHTASVFPAEWECRKTYTCVVRECDALCCVYFFHFLFISFIFCPYFQVYRFQLSKLIYNVIFSNILTEIYNCLYIFVSSLNFPWVPTGWQHCVVWNSDQYQYKL